MHKDKTYLRNAYMEDTNFAQMIDLTKLHTAHYTEPQRQ
jgi:hypothetical protein